MSKLSNFIKNLFSNLYYEIKEEIVMDEPQVKPITLERVKTKKSNTKHNQVKKHLLEKGWIDSWTAIELFGATRLSAIIFRLRKEGWDILSIPQSSYDRNKQICNYTTYKLNQK
jgi:hypothetical protein